MKKTDEEIRQEARDYWDVLVDAAVDSMVQNLLARGYTQPSPGVIPGIADPPVVPEVKSLNTFSSSLFNLLGESALDYDKFYRKGDLYNLVLRARKRAIEIHHKNRQQLTGRIRDLSNIRKTLAHRPASNREALECAINDLEYLQRFSGALLCYLEKEWPTALGFDENMDKDHRSQGVWDIILAHFYNQIPSISTKPLGQTEACIFMAEVLGEVYPNIWKGDIKENAGRIRSRLDRNIIVGKIRQLVKY